MPENKRIRVYYEGDDDRNVLEGLQSGGLLPGNAEIAKRSKGHLGREGLVHELAPFVSPVNGVGGSAITLLDLDDLAAAQLGSWFESTLKKELPKADSITPKSSQNPRLCSLEVSASGRSGRVVVVSVGLSEDADLLTSYGTVRFAIDDYLLRLVKDSAIFGSGREFQEVSHEKAMKKQTEVAQLFKANGIPLQRSKRYLHLLRAIIGFRASSAEFIRRLMGEALTRAGKDRLKELFQPLVADLHEAAGILAAV